MDTKAGAGEARGRSIRHEMQSPASRAPRALGEGKEFSLGVIFPPLHAEMTLVFFECELAPRVERDSARKGGSFDAAESDDRLRRTRV